MLRRDRRHIDTRRTFSKQILLNWSFGKGFVYPQSAQNYRKDSPAKTCSACLQFLKTVLTTSTLYVHQNSYSTYVTSHVPKLYSYTPLEFTRFTCRDINKHTLWYYRPQTFGRIGNSTEKYTLLWSSFHFFNTGSPSRDTQVQLRPLTKFPCTVKQFVVIVRVVFCKYAADE